VSDSDEVSCVGRLFHRLAVKTGKARLPTVIIIIIIIVQHLYSAMESEDTEALGGARLARLKDGTITWSG